jgi:hypothetical protein
MDKEEKAIWNYLVKIDYHYCSKSIAVKKHPRLGLEFIPKSFTDLWSLYIKETHGS